MRAIVAGQGILDRYNTTLLDASTKDWSKESAEFGGTYGSVCGLEAIELGLGARLELILRNLGLQDLLCDLPELVVLLVEEDHNARRL